jgi:hypothetical protein
MHHGVGILIERLIMSVKLPKRFRKQIYLFVIRMKNSLCTGMSSGVLRKESTYSFISSLTLFLVERVVLSFYPCKQLIIEVLVAFIRLLTDNAVS